ncbi:YwaF family protein [Mycoplasma crocodyli]|uniref:Putative membrane protein n=1 Tax=Mycoplasma crocodyli (strain ATCC 51981 / MP145) TaxID=512564 RepID=D5E6E2_MYCCM|nr:YwaF family protein [Mycoplasma crocodyli]ADE19920.1 putative membrane protein [Mycoplasma crocodyli MP145]
MNKSQFYFLEKGFFSWTGNHYTFHDITSQVIFHGFSIICFIAFFLLWLFKREITKSYQVKNSFLKRNESLVFQVIGFAILLFIILRISMLISRSYPNMWEIVPLHLCRLTLFLLAIFLIIKKTEYFKYVAIVQVGGAMIALLIPDMRFAYTFTESAIFNGQAYNAGQKIFFSVGWDNFFFMDYLLAHGFAILVPLIFFILKPTVITKKDTVLSFTFFGTILVTVFFINWTSYTFATSPVWKSNYFYVGKDDVNNLSNLFGVLSHWPFNVFTFTLFGAIYLLSGTGVYLLQDSVYFAKDNGKWVFRIQKSKAWLAYKETLKVFNKTTKQVER